MSDLKAGFIGLGAMGYAMAGHLHRAGFLTAVSNRTMAKAEQFAKEHAGVSALSPAELAAQCDVIIVCVSADADVIGVVLEIAKSAKPGTIVIDHSTVSSMTAKKASELLKPGKIEFLDAPVSGGVEGAKNGKLSEMIGGDAKTLERAKPVLEAYAARISHMGDVGAGQNTKSVNQVLVAGIAQATCEGLALGEALGLDPERLLPTLMAGAANSWFLEKRGATMMKNQFSVGFKLALLHKDLGIVDKLAKAAGTDRSVIEKSLADYAELMEQGHGDDDISGLIRLKRPR
jgi:3-hydroxyisobutyrate dehydrogenase